MLRGATKRGPVPKRCEFVRRRRRRRNHVPPCTRTAVPLCVPTNEALPSGSSPAQTACAVRSPHQSAQHTWSALRGLVQVGVHLIPIQRCSCLPCALLPAKVSTPFAAKSQFLLLIFTFTTPIACQPTHLTNSPPVSLTTLPVV